jgi:hypothetical protein
VVVVLGLDALAQRVARWTIERTGVCDGGRDLVLVLEYRRRRRFGDCAREGEVGGLRRA